MNMIYNCIDNIIKNSCLLASSEPDSHIFRFIDKSPISSLFSSIKEFFNDKLFNDKFFNDIQMNWNIIGLYMLVATGIAVTTIAIWNLLNLSLKKGSKDKTSRKSSAFTTSAVMVFTWGVTLYYIGYDYGGTHTNTFTLMLRSVLSSFEMFLSKSNLIGIAKNCKESGLYMFCFAIIHASALTISTLFAVLCFGKRVQYWFRGTRWRFIGSNDITNVFWGLNERSFVLAHDIAKNSDDKERFIFVDFPLQEESPSKGQSFSGILGLFSYKINALRKISGLRNCIMIRSSLRPSSVQDTNADFFDAMNIYRLKQILDKSTKVRFFLLTTDEDANLKAALNMLNKNVCANAKLAIYCSTRKNMLNRLIEERWENKLKLIDDSRAALTQLKMEPDKMHHPIDFVDIDKEQGCVTSKFKAMIIGFGSTGQDALRFLYEYSAFADKDGNKSPVEIHIIDNNLSAVKGKFWQEVPGMNMLVDKEVFFHDISAGSVEFDKFLNANIDQTNYVVVAAGSDKTNMDIASMIMDKALLCRTKKISHFKVFVRMYSDNSIVKFEAAVNVYKEFCSEDKYAPLEYFGNTREIYSYNIIVKNHYEEEAINFYNSYCKAEGSSTTWGERRKKEIMELGKIYGKRSLRRKEGQDKANCQHCYTKQQLLNLENRNEPLELPEWTDTESILDHEGATENHWLVCLYNVAICEHLRWNASHLMMGYVPMTADVKKHFDDTCDERTKQHTYIVDWNQLPCGTQGYDYSVVKTTVQIAKQNK